MDKIPLLQDAVTRRIFLWLAASFSLGIGMPARAGKYDTNSALLKFKKLELELRGRLGVFALNTADATRLDYRTQETFPVCSTFKVVAAAALLEQSLTQPGLMQRRLHYGHDDLVSYSPVTEKHVADGMTIAELCAAGMQYSDNTAANLMIKTLGGPAAVTAFARSIGDSEFRLDRWEPGLNTALPGDRRDTSTPAAMGETLRRLAIGDALPPAQREILQGWLCGNTTGGARIKAGLPADWKIGDKTGTGDYGTANDIAVVWPPGRAPVIIAIYTTQNEKDAPPRNDIIASAAKIVAAWLG